MKPLLSAVCVLALAFPAAAALQKGDHLQPYEVKNSRTGDEYCPVCSLGAKAGKIVAFGKLEDEGFWDDLQKLQAYLGQYPKLGVFAQVIDSDDLAAVKATAAKHGIKFPVVVAVEKDWDDIYKVGGVSRTIYYAKEDNEIVWTAVGLESATGTELESRLKADLAG